MLVCIALLGQLVGCSEQKTTSESKKETSISGVTVWSAPSTVKVAQDDVDYENKGEAALSYNAVRNEYESQQLLLTASKDVKTYELETSDLTCGEHTLSKEHVTVYNEKYLAVSDSTYEPGVLPDALIPQEAAKKYGEMVIAKDNNAALWITIYIPKDIPAGTYEGTFTLHVETQEMDIPVSVTVNDYTLADETKARTLFGSGFYNETAPAELDASIEMMTAYYEFFLDYRISLQTLPLESVTGEELLACLDKYYDELTSWCFLTEVSVIVKNMQNYKDVFREQLLAVAEASSPEKNYFEKVMQYTIDEPVLSNIEEAEKILQNYETVAEYRKEFAEEIERDTTGRFDNFKKIQGWKDYVINIPDVVPITKKNIDYILENADTEWVQRVLSVYNCICPIYDSFNQAQMEDLVALCEQNDIRIWWYGCVDPKAPAATYHINDRNLLSSRSITWLQKKLDIEGNLYWSTSKYVSGEQQYVNVYKGELGGESGTAGDGVLTYPGAAYGIYGPIPSIRLMSIRDGIEEYDILADLEENYEELKGKYGTDFSVSSCMNQFYQPLYNGDVAMYQDFENELEFDVLRKLLIDTAVCVDKGVGLAICNAEVENNLATVTYFVSDGCQVYIDDELQQRVGNYQYNYQMNLEEDTHLNMIVVAADETKYYISSFVAAPSWQLQLLSEEEVLDYINVSNECTVQIVNTDTYSTDGTSVQMDVKGYLTGNSLVDMDYSPTVSLETAMLENISNLSELTEMQIDIYNPGEAFTLETLIYSGTSFESMGEHEIINGKNTITLYIGTSKFSKMEQADCITFKFANSDDGITPNHYQLYVDNIVGIK